MSECGSGTISYLVFFKFGQHGQHAEDHFSASGGGIEGLGKGNEVNVFLFELVCDGDGIACGPCEAGESINDEHIAGRCDGESFLESGAVVCCAAGDAIVMFDDDISNTLGSGPCAAARLLCGEGVTFADLFFGGYAQIEDSSGGGGEGGGVAGGELGGGGHIAPFLMDCFYNAMFDNGAYQLFVLFCGSCLDIFSICNFFAVSSICTRRKFACAMTIAQLMSPQFMRFAAARMYFCSSSAFQARSAHLSCLSSQPEYVPLLARYWISSSVV